ncbi:MAG: hypothetical protein IIA61_05170 [Candidatus Marinimicrobia bacterium]|nr:hypothetical protein [Candidatus Neomarinimicrobiota bacterium]
MAYKLTMEIYLLSKSFLQEENTFTLLNS